MRVKPERHTARIGFAFVRRLAGNFNSPLPYLALTAFSLIAVQPLARLQVLCADDLLPHIHKAYALERLLRAGYWFPRWSPDLGQGFGYPLFNFYAPLSAYPLVFIHLAGLSYPLAIQVLLGLCLWLAGVGMYLFVRDLFGQQAGFVAGVAYMYAPYLAYDILFRGALAEVLGWVWIPFILWALRRATFERSWRWAAIAGLFYATLIPSHNLLAVLATPLVGGWVLVNALETREWKRLRFGGAALAWGLALAAYFWVPALAELNFIRPDRVLDPPLLRYSTNFITPAELLAPPRPVDPLLINPSPPRSLGVAAAVLAASALFALARPRFRRHALTVFYFALALTAYGWMTLQASQPVWDRVPLLAFIQFPWRMLAPAAACAAILVGAGVKGWEEIDWVGTAGVSVILVLADFPWLYPTYCGPVPATTSQSLQTLRADTFQEGAHAYSEYLPAWVQQFPQDDALYQALVSGEMPDRLAAEILPAGTTASALSVKPLDAEYHIVTPKSFEAIYKQFYYPGWRAEVDGHPAAIRPTSDAGLIRFRVPEGEHSVRVRYGETPLRAVADTISIIAVLTWAIVIAFSYEHLCRARSRREVSGVVPKVGSVAQPAGLEMPLRTSVGFISLGLALLLLKVGVIDRFPNPLRRMAFDGTQVRGIQPLRASFAGGVELYGYDLSSPTVASGESFDVTLWAGVRESVERRYVPSMSVEDEAGLVWNNSRVDFPRWLRAPYSADAWPIGLYALWARRIEVRPGTPPGHYHLWGTVFDQDTLAPDSLIDSAGNTLAPRFDLGEITISRPRRPAEPASLQMQPGSRQALNEALTLLGYNLDRSEARPGDRVLVTLFWRADRDPGADLLAVLGLVDQTGRVSFTTQLDPGGPDFPTSAWRAGDVWRGQHLIRLPASLEAGFYQWVLALAPSLDGAPAPLGQISISAPERGFEPLPVQHTVGARLGDVAELVGYSTGADAAQAAQALKLTLIWRALSTPAASYSVFVHLSDAQGRVWAQSDGLPQNWERPTTGWLPGEYVRDDRTLALPADLPDGIYALYAGMADAVTGARLPADGPRAEADRRIAIGVVQVGE